MSNDSQHNSRTLHIPVTYVNEGEVPVTVRVETPKPGQ